MVNNKNKRSNKGINNNINEQTNIKQKRKTGSINRKKLIVVLLVVLIVLSFAIYKIGFVVNKNMSFTKTCSSSLKSIVLADWPFSNVFLIFSNKSISN